jgi:signal transduction histidine kinase
MIAKSLSARILAVSAIALLVFGAASFAMLYRAQTQLADRAMDSLLKNDIFSLSNLVNLKPDGTFDFEITPLALSDYQNNQSGEFFRFIDPKNGHVYIESPGAPKAGCESGANRSWTREFANEKAYLIRGALFQPELDPDFKTTAPIAKQWICLIVGADEQPYRSLVIQTWLSTVPVLVALILLTLGILLTLLRSFTKDLSELARALQVADFEGTHEFPTLPKAETTEVKAVVEKLHDLHQQASEVYHEMWLFLGRAAHQLKTPVAGIQATLQVLLRKDRSKEELLAGLSDIQSGVDLLSLLTQKLTASSRISFQSAGEKVAVDLEEFFREQSKIYRSAAEKRGIRIELYPSDAVCVLGSISLLSEIFGNLIENAILYSNENGIVGIQWEAHSNRALVSISDQGHGFAAVVQENLFKPFVRGDERSIAGSGLGLSSAHKAAQLLGGDIQLAESTTKGSRLVVSLPTIQNVHR